MDAKDKKIATDLCCEIIKRVGRAIRPYVGKPESGEKVKMGVTATPASYIVIIEVNQVINILKMLLCAHHIIGEDWRTESWIRKKSVVLTQELRRTVALNQKPKFIFLIDPIDQYKQCN